MIFSTKLRFVVVLCFGLLSTGVLRAQAERTLRTVAASRDGSILVFGIEDLDLTGSKRANLVVAIRPSTGLELWRYQPPAPPRTIAFSPDGKSVAVGLWGQNPAGEGVFLLRAASGEQLAALGGDDTLQVDPGAVYPRWGGGMERVEFSPDGALLYGLTGDTLFAWDVAAQKYLWAQDVPAVIEAPPDLSDPLPYGHATDFTLSPDGKQIAALRDVLRVATAGRTRPRHFIKRATTKNSILERAVFSADSRILAASEYSTTGGKRTFVATEMWTDGALKSSYIGGCGEGIAWTYDNSIFACQNDSGAHLRNIHDPQKDIGAAGPPGNLPILKVGKSLWSAAYTYGDWKDPAKPLTITLGELGTGKRVTLALPGR